MKKLIIFFLILGNFGRVWGQELVGNISTEEGIALEKVLIINLKTGEKKYSNNEGGFAISAKNGEEIRFVREGYDRIAHLVKQEDFERKLSFKMYKTAQNIEEVVITKISKEKLAELKNSIGLPEPLKTKPKVPNTKEVLLPVLLGQLNVDGMKDLITGDARRKKNLYKYEEFQENVQWVKDRVDTAYFIEKGVPEERLAEFIAFVITEKPAVKNHIKSKNIRAIEKLMEDVLPIYLGRLK